MKKFKKILKYLVIFAVIGGGIWWWYSRKGKNAANIDIRALVPDKVVKAQRGDIRRVVSGTGSVVNNRDVTIKCKAGGQIIKLPFDVSDVVKEGDILMQLDPVDEERNLQQAQVNLKTAENDLETAKLNLKISWDDLKNSKQRTDANIRSSEINLKNTRRDYERNRQLFAKKLISQEVMDKSEQSYENSQITHSTNLLALEDLKNKEMSLQVSEKRIFNNEAAVENKRISLQDAEQRLKETTVVSPTRGVISELAVQVGDMVASSTTNTGGGTKIMTISDNSRMFTNVDVDESEIVNIKPGLPVEIRTESVDERKYKGKVVRIDPKGTRTRGVVTFKVRVEFIDDDLSVLRAEMSTNIDVILAERKDVIKVPLRAVSQEKGKYFVTLPKSVKDKVVPGEKREVKTGLTDGENIEICEGLNEGEEVLITVSADESRWIQKALNRDTMTQWSSGKRVGAIRRK